MVSDDWYTASLRQEMSQGDIVSLVATGLIDDPLTVCVPDNSSPQGRARYAPAEAVTTGKQKYLHATFSLGLGMVVWPNCQIDKLKNQGSPMTKWFAAVAPVRPMRDLNPDYRATVVAMERAQWFPLPTKLPDLPEECFVDLRRSWPVRWSLLSKRVASLTDDAQAALRMHMFWFSTELSIREPLQCPHCQQELALEDVLAQKPPEPLDVASVETIPSQAAAPPALQPEK